MRMETVLAAIYIYGQVFAASRGYVEVPLRRTADSMYQVESVVVGRKRQAMENVILDTGSADLVLTGATYAYEKSQFVPQYVAQYGSSAPFALFEQQDAVAGDGWKVPQMTFGVTNVSAIDSFSGVFGIGYASIEAMDPYDNFPMALESQGLIDAQMYSLLGRPEGAVIVFGGIDTRTYRGPLAKTPIGFEIGPHSTRQYHTVTAVTVNTIAVVAHNRRTRVSAQKLLYTLDTGSNGLMVPSPVYANLVAGLDAKKHWHHDVPYFRQTSLAAASLAFNITGYTVSVPVSDLVDECMAVRGARYCSLRIGTVDIGTDSYVGTLPNCVFKYMYTVFDLGANEVLMAPYHDSSDGSIKPVAALGYPVPTTTAPGYHDVYSTMYDAASEVTVAGPGRCRQQVLSMTSPS